MKIMASLYEEMGGTYHLGADGLCYPDLLPPSEDTPTYGKYGRLRRSCLKEQGNVKPRVLQN